MYYIDNKFVPMLAYPREIQDMFSGIRWRMHWEETSQYGEGPQDEIN